MKKVILITTVSVIVCACSFPAIAQEGTPLYKGRWQVGGAFSFSTASSKGNSLSIVQLSPSALYFASDRFGIGGAISVTSVSSEHSSSTSSMFGPKVAYYFETNSPTVLPYIGAGVLFGTSSSGSTSTTIDLNGGVLFMLNWNVGLNGGLDVQFINYKNTDQTVFTLLVGFNVFLP